MDFSPFSDGGVLEGGDWPEDGFRGMPQFAQAQNQFRKAALQSGYGTDVAAYTGGRALQLQSIEDSLTAAVERVDHFKLSHKLSTGTATATVHENIVMNDIGGFPGSGFNGELDAIAQEVGDYARTVVKMKYIMRRRAISAVQNSTRTRVDSMTREQQNGALSTMRDIEWGLFEGDERVNPFEFDGLRKIIEVDVADTKLILDARGEGLSPMGREVLDIAQIVNDAGFFGHSTDIYCSPSVQNAEFDQKLAPGVRIPLNPGEGGSRSYDLGTPVGGVKSSFGRLDLNNDIFIQEGDMPWEVQGGTKPALVTASGLPAPAIASLTAGAHASSLFTSDHSGSYYWGVAAKGKAGRGLVTVSAQQAVLPGERAVLTVTNPANTGVTGFLIYRGRRNGTNGKIDMRLQAVIPRTGAADGVATTVYNDNNGDIPGTSRVYVLNLAPADDAIKLVRLLPMMKFSLYPTDKAEIPWAQLWFGALMVKKQKQHGVIKNVLPRSATWRPFN
jgi:hypothetical protein